MRKDYFATLGVKPTASEKEIRSAYKKLAKKYHPDVNPNNKQAEERFKEISEAYEVLTDPDKRRAWESGGSSFDPFAGRGSSRRGARGRADANAGFEEGDFSSILNDLFSGMGGFDPGRRARGDAPRRGDDLQYGATITLQEALSGTTLKIPLAHTVTCETCGGQGV